MTCLVATIGYHQGSVLCVIVFSLYTVNSLCNGKFEGSLVALADDTALFCKAEYIFELQDNMQNYITPLMW